MSDLSDSAATVVIFPMTDDLVQRQGEEAPLDSFLSQAGS
jgi:hypothetical protein